MNTHFYMYNKPTASFARVVENSVTSSPLWSSCGYVNMTLLRLPAVGRPPPSPAPRIIFYIAAVDDF